VEDLRSNGEVVIPKNSQVVGHITQIQARSKEQTESQIAIAFDRLIINGGGEIALSASIQAVAAPETRPADESQQAAYGGMPNGAAAAGGRGGSPSGAAGAASPGANPDAAAQSGGRNSGGLSPTSEGVIGIRGLSLSTQSDSSQGSVISSNHQNVRLEHGTQLVLRVNAK
jgi:hypothetical protein